MKAAIHQVLARSGFAVESVSTRKRRMEFPVWSPVRPGGWH